MNEEPQNNQVNENKFEELPQVLQTLELSTKPLSEHEISDIIKKLKQKDTDQIPLPFVAEVIAFDFMEAYPNEKWGTYFGPMMEWGDANNNQHNYPDITQVNSQIMDYWQERADKTENPILKARYNGLLWDFSSKVLNVKPSYVIAKSYVEALLAVAERKLQNEHGIYTKLTRAIHIASLINAQAEISRATTILLKYHTDTVSDAAPGYWAKPYDILLKEFKLGLTPDQESKIIDDLESRLLKLQKADVNNKQLYPWNYETLALPLLDYYRRKGNALDLERVLNILGNAFELSSEVAEPMLASSWLQHIHSIYIQYGASDKASKVLIKIEGIGKKVNESLKTFSVEQKIPTEELEKYVQSFLTDDLEKALIRVAIRFIPEKDQMTDQLKKLAEDAPFSYLITRQLQDHRGRIVAVIGGIRDDLDRHIILQTSNYIQMSWFFLWHVLDGIKRKFTPSAEDIIDFCYQSPVFEKDRKEILSKGIEAYLKDDHLQATHILIPQIENAFRNLIVINDGNILKKNDDGGFDVKGMGDILRHPLINEIFGEDAAQYLKILYVDRKGLNLRNDLCHGLLMSGSFNSRTMDWVFHSLLLLGLIRKRT